MHGAADTAPERWRQAGPLRVRLQLAPELDRLLPDDPQGGGPAAAAPADTVRLACWDKPLPPLPVFRGPEDHLYQGDRVANHGYRLTRRDTRDAAGRYAGAEIDGECLAREGSLAMALRVSLQPSLARLGWLLVHSSAVRLADGVHVFTAASGTGKSTLAARLVGAGGLTVADDVALVGDGFASTPPEQARHGTPGALQPLAALHVLRRGAARMNRLSHARATAELLGGILWFETGRAATERALALVDELAARVPVFETFVPNSDDALALFPGPPA